MKSAPAYAETAPARGPERRRSKPAPNRIELLLALEGEALRAPDRRTLRHLAVNQSRRLVPYGHGVFLTRSVQPGPVRYIAKSISSQGVVDRNAPLVRWLEAKVSDVAERAGSAPLVFALANDFGDSVDLDYPFRQALWLPLANDAGVLLTRAEAWQDSDVRVLSRLSDVYNCAWRALAPVKRKSRSSVRVRRALQIGGVALLAAMFWPVSMTTLAPAEIVAVDPQIVSAPLDGVIEAIHVEPNALVKPGDVLATYVDTETRNQFALAREEVAVAAARLDRTAIAAFSDAETKREIRIMQSELALAERRRAFAEENLEKATLVADTEGVVLISDPQEWTGRPVAIGQRIMQIADPARVEVKIEAPVSDGELLRPGAHVRLFLDSDPIHALEGELRHASHFPETTPAGTLAYMSFADFEGDEAPRLGARGVAKIHGGQAPFIFWVMRRPVVFVRQFLGI